MHFMNPVPVMKLVEIVRGLATDDATYQTVTGARASGSARSLMTAQATSPASSSTACSSRCSTRPASRCTRGSASSRTSTPACKLGLNHPMGPLELADLIGLDTCLAIAEVLHAELGDDKYRPCPLLRQYVAAGWLGRKVGRGFYEYDAGGPRMPSYENVRYEVDGFIATVTIAREKALNALNRQTLNEIGWALRDADGDARVRCVILTGAGDKAFVAGADIAEMADQGATEARGVRRAGRAVGDAIESMRQAGDRRGQRLRARRRLRARAGLRLHLRQRQGEVRPARGQARRHPRLRRHAAAAAARRRRDGEGAVHDRRHRSTPTRRCASASSTRSFPRGRAAWPRRASAPSKIAAKGPLAIADARRAVRKGQSSSTCRRGTTRGRAVRAALRDRRIRRKA